MQLLILFGFYAAAISSALLPLYAMRSGKYAWVYVAAFLATPICLFIAGYASLYYVPAVFPLCMLLGAYCIKKQRQGWAFLFFSPYLALWLGFMIIVLVNLKS